ncbi:MAG: hypothetical protein AAB436_01070 [Patescibacteria group bacterium]
MFGHQDDTSQQDDTTDASQEPTQAVGDNVPNQSTLQPDPLSPATVADPDPQGSQPTTAPYLTDAPDWQHPGPPPADAPTEPAADLISPAGGFPKPLDYKAFSTETTPPPPPPPSLPPAPASDDILDVSSTQLIEIKTQALNELSPLIDQLDQTPEEKFKTVMMLIQASDNQDLVKKAYEAAHGIKEEKARAQALLDIVNEINYFTTPHGS